jgi:uncharacterized protein YndB with AHSA1/START domain
MTVTDTSRDAAKRTMTITAEFDAPVDRTWTLWEDPRLLERWWGPPSYPATFVDHALTPGSVCTYYMTGPEGDRPHGWWKVRSVEAPRRLEFEDGFADESGVPNPDMPTMEIRVTLEDRPDGGTRMMIETTFPSVEAMEQILAMGVEEGMTQAMSQMDALL